ncbi:MAG TPA: toll/interleukin-1 receptor domain-containing protein [Steroidobacteraceae bacterium]|jgi:hypothetical protein
MAGEVFVSYSQPDRACAFDIVGRLEASGLGVWVAPRDIAPSADWAEEIVDAIGRARIMVLVFSSHCNGSPQVRREVERAVHRDLPILPFRVENVMPARSLEYFLSTQHWLDAFSTPRDAHYEKLVDNVRKRLAGGKEAPSTERTPPATLEVPDLETIESSLRFHVGPIARVLVRRALGTARSREDLIASLAAEIGSEPGRRDFLQRVRVG